MKKISVSIILILCFAVNGYAGLPAAFVGTPASSMAEDFLDKLMQGNADGAYDALFSGLSVPPAGKGRIEELKRKTVEAMRRAGRSFGYELVRKEAYGRSIVRLLYVLKFDQSALVWEFYFYKPKDRWIVLKVDYGYDLRLLPK